MAISKIDGNNNDKSNTRSHNCTKKKRVITSEVSFKISLPDNTCKRYLELIFFDDTNEKHHDWETSFLTEDALLVKSIGL